MAHQIAETKVRAGFTLIELLVVIAIMALLGSMMNVALNSSGKSTTQGLSSGLSAFASMVQSARTIAVTKGRTSRLIVNNDPANPDHYLRLMGIVYDDPGTAADDWIAVNQGQLLPRNVYVIADSDTDATNIDDTNGKFTTLKGVSDDAAGTMDLAFPLRAAQTEGSGDPWIYYEFRSDGVVSSGTANKVVVLAVGSMDGAGNIVFENEYLSGGVMISLFGGTLTGEYDDL